MKTRKDIYEEITTTIIEAIEAGCRKFEMPWHTLAGMPCNASTQRRYRGVNILVLWAAATKQNYRTNLWATYQQWSELGAQVRKGSKSTPVVFWKFYGEENEDESGEGNEDVRTRCFARAYHVFNADQVEGFVLPHAPELPQAERIDRVERFFQRTRARIVERGVRACYDPQSDEISMPPFALFKKADYFYSVLAHEMVHNAAPRIMPPSSLGAKQDVKFCEPSRRHNLCANDAFGET
jgi:antirestriction protein ArdC